MLRRCNTLIGFEPKWVLQWDSIGRACRGRRDGEGAAAKVAHGTGVVKAPVSGAVREWWVGGGADDLNKGWGMLMT